MALKINYIILADDDLDDRNFFTDIIQGFDASIKVELVSDGVLLMDLLRHLNPDLLFLDLEMPRQNGLQCLVELRKNPQLENLPTIVFSSSAKPANIQTAYELGAHLYLIKSSSYKEYAASLQAILRLDWTDPNAIKEQYCVNSRYAAFS